VKVLAIIPARGGSKGIPKKNLRKLAGKPLIEYTISAAKNSKLISKIIVSTDDKKIAKLSESLGVDVPFLRPKNISQDNSKTLDVINHSIDFLKISQDYIPDIVILLQPTSPLRTTRDIDKSIQLLKQKKCSSVISVKKIKEHPNAAFKLSKKNLKPVMKNFEQFYQRQKFPDLFFPTGGIYTFWYETLKNTKNIYGSQITPLIISDESMIDIDNPLDFFICESIIINQKKIM
jgi:CMP-N,N'-diacetyllegionaminic acid synthase